nr:MAG: replication initiator protein [Microvirus sp.]
MPCYSPLTAYYTADKGVSGKRGITFDRNASLSGEPLRLPCGQCIGCRLDRSLQWAVRCMHEKQLHERSAFVTLTYDNDHLPEGGTLVKRDCQLFMKRLRKVFGVGIRFYMGGEYGAKSLRPHYHYLFFNIDFDDKKYYAQAKRGERLYTSKMLTELWPYGFNVIGDVTLESCAYVARYVVDKITGERADAHYRVVTEDGVVVDRSPEFNLMSRRPGIASEWYERYGVHSHRAGDFAVMEGKRVRMPRFYDTRYEVVDSDGLEVLKKRRRRNASRHRADNTPDRRRVREQVAIRKLQQKSRDGE